LPVALERLSPAERISDIPAAVPIVIISGSADSHARLDDVKTLFQSVQSHAKLVVFEGAAHEPLDQNNPDLYHRTLFEFLATD
jgi:alpha-beta hydrolase superfamily lysophospholipase